MLFTCEHDQLNYFGRLFRVELNNPQGMNVAEKAADEEVYEFAPFSVLIQSYTNHDQRRDYPHHQIFENHNASGRDNIYAMFLKIYPNKSIDICIQLIQKILKTETLPSSRVFWLKFQRKETLRFVTTIEGLLCNE